MIRVLIPYVLLAAARDKLFIGFLLLVAVAVSLSFFFGVSALNEKDQFSLIFAASTLRIGGVFTLVLFVIFYLRRTFETGGIEYLLSRPITRLDFLISHSLAFIILATIVTAIIGLIVMVMPELKAQQGADFIWLASLWVEYVIMVNVAMFFALVLPSAITATLICTAFYCLSRLIGDILGIIHAADEGGVFTLLMEKVMLVVSVIIPRLDMLAQSSWLLYGVDTVVNWPFILLQGAIFTGLVVAASYWDLNRRQF